MKKRQIPIYILTCFLTVLIICFSFFEEKRDGHLGLSAVIYSGVHQEKIVCQEIGDGQENRYCIFLPSYADLSETVLRTDMFHTVFLNGQKLGLETPMCDFELDKPYEFICHRRNGSDSGSILFVQSKNLATLYIDTASGNMDYVHQSQENKESGRIALYDEDGTLDCRSNLTYIKGRGNSTWGQDKKPYNFKLKQAADLLGMGEADTWVLLAQVMDTTQAKSKLIYDFSERVGMPFAPDSDWVNLYLNGAYVGVYLLCEHVEIHPERVDIDQKGSFLVSVEGTSRLKNRGLVYTAENGHLALRIRHADMPIERVEELWVSARTAILAEDGVDPVSGKHWTELIDLDSWVTRYLVDEVFANYDGGYFSQFYYYTDLGNSPKIYAGPVWDVDLSFADISDWWPWQTKKPYCIHAGRPNLVLKDDEPLFYTLCQKEEFHQRMIELYQTVFLPELSRLLTEDMRQYPDYLFQAVKLDALRWYSAGFEEYLGATEENYLYFTNFCEDYLAKRIDFLNALWLEKAPYCFVQINPNSYNVWGNYAIRPGETLPEITMAEGMGLYHYGTDLPFDSAKPIYEDQMLYMAPMPESQ